MLTGSRCPWSAGSWPSGSRSMGKSGARSRGPTHWGLRRSRRLWRPVTSRSRLAPGRAPDRAPRRAPRRRCPPGETGPGLPAAAAPRRPDRPAAAASARACTARSPAPGLPQVGKRRRALRQERLRTGVLAGFHRPLAQRIQGDRHPQPIPAGALAGHAANGPPRSDTCPFDGVPAGRLPANLGQ